MSYIFIVGTSHHTFHLHILDLHILHLDLTFYTLRVCIFICCSFENRLLCVPIMWVYVLLKAAQRIVSKSYLSNLINKVWMHGSIELARGAVSKLTFYGLQYAMSAWFIPTCYKRLLVQEKESACIVWTCLRNLFQNWPWCGNNMFFR